MAETIYGDEVLMSQRRTSHFPYRIFMGLRRSFQELATGLSDSRQDFRRAKGLEDLSHRQLRDIGIERDSC